MTASRTLQAIQQLKIELNHSQIRLDEVPEKVEAIMRRYAAECKVTTKDGTPFIKNLLSISQLSSSFKSLSEVPPNVEPVMMDSGAEHKVTAKASIFFIKSLLNTSQLSSPLKKLTLNAILEGKLEKKYQQLFEEKLSAPVDIFILHELAKLHGQRFYIPEPVFHPEAIRQQLEHSLNQARLSRIEQNFKAEMKQIQQQGVMDFQLLVDEEKRKQELDSFAAKLKQAEKILQFKGRQHELEISHRDTLNQLKQKEQDLISQEENLQFNQQLFNQALNQKGSYYESKNYAEQIKAQLSTVDSALSGLSQSLHQNSQAQAKAYATFATQLSALQTEMGALIKEEHAKTRKVIVDQIDDSTDKITTQQESHHQANQQQFKRAEIRQTEYHQENVDKLESVQSELFQIKTNLGALKGKTLTEKLNELKQRRLNDESIKNELASYIPVRCGEDFEDDKHQDADGEITQFLRSDKKVLLLLGDSGVGKSMFGHFLERQLWQNYTVGSNQPLPIFINLLTAKDPNEELIERHLRHLGFSNDEIHTLKSQHRMVCLLDGYDEIQGEENLYQTNQLSQWRNLHVIISCRSQYLLSTDYKENFYPDIDEQVEASLFQQRVLKSFEQDQIEAYLQKYVEVNKPIWKNWKDYWTHIQQLENIKELITNPFILRIIAEVLPEVVAQQALKPDANQLTRNKLYEAFANRWFDRQVLKLRKQKLPAKKLRGIKAAFWDYSKRLASSILDARETTGRLSVRYAATSTWGEPEASNDAWAASFFKDDEETNLLRSGCPLKQVGPDEYTFIHKSMLEFFSSRFQQDQLKKLAVKKAPAIIPKQKWSTESQKEATPALTPESAQQIAGQDLNKRLLNAEPSIIDFMVDMLKQGELTKEQLLGIVLASRTNPKVTIASANAMTILNQADLKRVCLAPFAGLDLQGVCIAGANLMEANLHKTNLSGADLRGIDFRYAHLQEANFKKANMQGVEFGELPSLLHKTVVDAISKVYALAYSSDGCWIATGCLFNNIYLWDAASGELKQTLSGHTKSVSSVHFSPDSQLLASGGGDKTVRIWSVASGELKQTLSGHTGYILSIQFSPDGKLLASGSENRTVRIWSVARGELKQTLLGHTARVNSVHFSPDGQLLASGSGDGTVRIWSVASGELKQTLLGHAGQVNSVHFSPNGKLLASGNGRTVCIWSVARSELKQTLLGHTGLVNSVHFSPDGKLLASGSQDYTARIWRVARGELKQTLSGHTDRVFSVHFSPDGKLLASGSDDNTVRIWRVARGELKQMLSGHTHRVFSIHFSPDSQLLASGSDDKTVHIWRVASGEVKQTLAGHTYCKSVHFSPDGQLLASGGGDKTVRIWSVARGELKQTLSGPTSVDSIHFSPDGKLLASGGNDKTVRIWSVARGELKQTLSGHTDWVNSVYFSPDGQLLASGSWDKTVCIWSVARGELKQTLLGHTERVYSVHFSPNGKLLASGSWDDTVRIWNVVRGELKQTFSGHTGRFNSVHFSPNSQLLVSGSEDGTLRIWSVKNGQCLSVFQAHLSVIKSINFSKNNQYLATGSEDKAIHVYKLNHQAPDLNPQLFWTSQSYLQCDDLQFEGAELSSRNARLLEQKGAKGKAIILSENRYSSFLKQGHSVKKTAGSESQNAVQPRFNK